MKRVGAGAGEDYPKTLSARENIETLLADPEIAASFPEIVGSFTFEPEFDPLKQQSDPEERPATTIILREGYDDDPVVVLVELLDIMRAAVENGATEEYLRGLLRKTGLKPQQARLRFDKNAGEVNIFETNGQTGLES